MTRHAIYPGSFDPVTNGHLDIVRRCRPLFDRVTVAVAVNPSKHPMFSVSERLQMLSETFAEFDHVEVASFSGLLVNFARDRQAQAIVRGLRAVSDFEYELQMALMNRRLAGTIETIFLMPSEEYTYLSSSIIKGVALAGGDVSSLVPPGVETLLKKKAHR
ncbi:MAG: pantetheine-phosphate adenylyltransferase [Nitrospirota bacterium]|nr:pantetheine-phosphate adenylyltransferase [Nitrospirota bacterium]